MCRIEGVVNKTWWHHLSMIKKLIHTVSLILTIKKIIRMSVTIECEWSGSQKCTSHWRVQKELFVLLVSTGGVFLYCTISAFTTVDAFSTSLYEILIPRASAVTRKNKALIRSSVLADTKWLYRTKNRAQNNGWSSVFNSFGWSSCQHKRSWHVLHQAQFFGTSR